MLDFCLVLLLAVFLLLCGVLVDLVGLGGLSGETNPSLFSLLRVLTIDL